MNRSFLSLLVIGLILLTAIYLTYNSYRTSTPEDNSIKLTEEMEVTPTSLPESTSSASPSGQQ